MKYTVLKLLALLQFLYGFWFVFVFFYFHCLEGVFVSLSGAQFSLTHKFRK